MKILFRGPIGSVGGYARDGMGIVKELCARRHDVYLEPTQVTPPMPVSISNLLTKPYGQEFDLELHHTSPTAIEVGGFNKQRSRKVVLWTMWEWDNVIPEIPGFDNAKAMIGSYDHVFTYTAQTAQAFEKAGFFRPDQLVTVLQGGIDPTPWTPYEGTPEGEKIPPRTRTRPKPFRFAMLGHLTLRKNVFGVYAAFRELKEELGDDFDAKLVFKTTYPLPPFIGDTEHVEVLQEPAWSEKEIRAFYWSIDCLVNCAYGEGKDLPAMEAALCGTPVILNDTPGHKGWVHPTIIPLVPTHIGSLGTEQGRETEVEDIKQAMLRVYKGQVQAHRQSTALAQYINRNFTWGKRLDKMAKELDLPL